VAVKMATELILNSSFGSNNEQPMTQILRDYDSLHHNYITMKSTEKFLQNLINEPTNLNYDTEEPLSCDEIEEEFTQSKQEFINEVIEFRKGCFVAITLFSSVLFRLSELQRKDQLQEEARSPSDSIEIDEEDDEDNEEAHQLQLEMEEIEMQLALCDKESQELDQELAGAKDCLSNPSLSVFLMRFLRTR
jgi:TATA-binding protein-associated factor Taf7